MTRKPARSTEAAGEDQRPDAGGAYDAETVYEVTLLRVARWQGLELSPAHSHQLKGKVCAAIAGDIADARPV